MIISVNIPPIVKLVKERRENINLYKGNLKVLLSIKLIGIIDIIKKPTSKPRKNFLFFIFLLYQLTGK